MALFGRAFLASAICLSASCSMAQEPSEALLVSMFEEHIESFEALRELATADVARCREHFKETNCDLRIEARNDGKIVSLKPNEFLSQEDVDEYLRLTSTIGLPEALIQTGETYVEILTYRQGLSVAGSSKAYLWQTTAPEPLYDSLDEEWVSNSDGSYKFGYRRLKDSWYLSYVTN